jgi:hypothetical protein
MHLNMLGQSMKLYSALVSTKSIIIACGDLELHKYIYRRNRRCNISVFLCKLSSRIIMNPQYNDIFPKGRYNSLVGLVVIIINYHPKYWHQRFVGTTNAEYAKLNIFYTIKEYPETETTSKQSMANAKWISWEQANHEFKYQTYCNFSVDLLLKKWRNHDIKYPRNLVLFYIHDNWYPSYTLPCFVSTNLKRNITITQDKILFYRK